MSDEKQLQVEDEVAEEAAVDDEPTAEEALVDDTDAVGSDDVIVAEAEQDNEQEKPSGDPRRTKCIVCSLIPVVLGLLIAVTSANSASPLERMTPCIRTRGV